MEKGIVTENVCMIFVDGGRHVNKQLDQIAKKYRRGFTQKYNVAKMINFIVIFFSFIIAVLSVKVTIHPNNQFKGTIAFVSFFWTVISIYLNKYIGSEKKIAADLQELYDIYVLNIEKNEKIMYPTSSKYDICKYGKSIDDDYYSIDYNNFSNDDIFLIQRENIKYDKRMRKRYYTMNKLYLWIYIVVMIFVSIKMKLDMFNLIVFIVVPSVNIFNYFIKNIINLNFELIQIEEGINDISNFVSSLKYVSENEKFKEIRKYQDFIYLKRRNWTMIPNYIYKLYRMYTNFIYEIKEENMSRNNNENLQEEAINIEKTLGIVDFLSKYGRAEIVGSVANNLIINKDIDIHLLTDDDIYTIRDKVIIFLQGINFINNIEIEDYKNEKEAVCIIIKNFKAWNIEIWICTSEKYVGFHMKETLQNNLDDNTRKIIMDIKRYYYNKGALHGKMSTMIYKGVLDGQVKNVDDFKQYIMKTL